MSLGYSNLEIPFGSKTHVKLMEAFGSRLRIARSGITQRSVKWSENEDMMKAYVKETDNDLLRKDARKRGQPNYTTIEVPYSYAVMLTLHTYMTSIFLSRNPIMQVSGRHGEAEQAVQAIEALLDYQITTGGALPQLYVWLLDPLRYGHGVIGHYWDEEIVTSTVITDKPKTFLGMEIPGTSQKVKET